MNYPFAMAGASSKAAIRPPAIQSSDHDVFEATLADATQRLARARSSQQVLVRALKRVAQDRAEVWQ